MLGPMLAPLRTLLALVVALVASTVGAATPEGRFTLVAAAPGYPGDTAQAQPTMDAFALAVAARAGWPADRLGAVYHEALAAGLARLARPDATLALVPLPFYLEYGEQLELRPLLEIAPLAGPDEAWSLVARRGALGAASSLDGLRIAAIAGYSPRFVRQVVLAGWREPEDGATVEFESRVLSALRRAAAGEPLAVLLDRAQLAALPSLPFAKDLEVVATSTALPGSLLCAVAGRIDDGAAQALRAALLELDGDAAGRALLESIQVGGFRVLDAVRLEAIERLFSAAGAPTNAR